MTLTTDELRALAAALPPSERLAASEVADVLSSVVAVIKHGPAILAAAKEGGDKVYEFFHNVIAEQAAAAGHPAPERGQIAQTAPPATPVAAQTIDYDQLAAAIVRQQNAAQAAQAATTEKPATDGAPAATETAPASHGGWFGN